MVCSDKGLAMVVTLALACGSLPLLFSFPGTRSGIPDSTRLFPMGGFPSIAHFRWNTDGLRALSRLQVFQCRHLVDNIILMMLTVTF